jgi:hypothetical protein
VSNNKVSGSQVLFDSFSAGPVAGEWITATVVHIVQKSWMALLRRI